MTVLSGCAKVERVPNNKDYVLRSNVPQPLWMSDEMLNAFAYMPESAEIDDYLARYVVQQEQLEALHGK